MRSITMRNILSLPPTLLSLLLASSPVFATEAPLEWPYNLPRTSKYYPEHEVLLKRDLQAQEKLARQIPVGMRKMSEDEGEKFFFDYWDFGDEFADSDSGNASTSLAQPLAEHFAQRSWPRALSHNLFARQWGSCPSGYQSCTSIQRPDSCCASGSTCISVTDTGNGDVGCCPPGASCGTTISGCDTGSGQTECPGSGNGGCCIAGYACFDVGCVFASTQTVVTTLAVATVTTGAQTRTTSSSAGTTVVGGGGAGGSVYTTTVTQVTTRPGSPDTTTILQPTTVTVTPSTAPASTAVGQGPLTCSASFTSCPASLGGGCCYTGYACGAISCSGPSSTVETSSEATLLPPARPTSSTDVPISQASITSTPSSTTVVTGDSCPTGFYMCSAYYLGGCCRVGRNCDTTSCPSSASTAVISNTDLTVVAITSTTTVGSGGSGGAAAAQGTQGSCANGFYSCAAGQGGGCCPQGYVCGASCTATVSGVGDQPKTAPSEASVVRWGWGLGLLGVGSALGMVWL